MMDIPVIDERCQRVMTFLSLMDLVATDTTFVQVDDLEHLGTTLTSLWEMGEITMVCQIWSDLNKNKELMVRAKPYVETVGFHIGQWAISETKKRVRNL